MKWRLALLCCIIPVTVLAEEARSTDITPFIFKNEVNPPVDGKGGAWQPLRGWGEIRFPSSEQLDDNDNLIVEGAFNKDVILRNYSSTFVVKAFGSVNYVSDTEGFDFNNKLRPAVGVALQYYPFSGIVVENGIKYELDYRLRTQRTLHGGQFFTNWFAGWNLPFFDSLKKRNTAFPGFTWGGVRYPGSQDDEEESNIIVEGAVEQGVDWYHTDAVTINSYIELKYIADKEEYSYNNHVTFSVGSKLRIPIGNEITFQPGVKYSVNKRFLSGKVREDTIFFVNWFF
ncbi:MAG: hypothetical protein R3D71_10145 [Rickettsiales bacterium]